MSFPTKCTPEGIQIGYKLNVLHNDTLFQNPIFPVPDLMFHDLAKIYSLRRKDCVRGVSRCSSVSPCLRGFYPGLLSICPPDDRYMNGWKSGLIPCFYPVPVFNQNAQITGGTWTQLFQHLFKYQYGWDSRHFSTELWFNYVGEKKPWPSAIGLWTWRRAVIENACAEHSSLESM